MKLPAQCPHRRSGKKWSSCGDGALPCCRQVDGDIAVYMPKRGPLCQRMNIAVEEYRFSWDSSFNGSAQVSIDRGEKNIIVDWARSDFRGGFGRFWKCIEDADWRRLEAALLCAGFWSLDPVVDEFGFDGAYWLIEGRRRDVYRAVKRWSPDGAIFDLGRAFLDIAGPPIADIELY
jgi:hypothetical protein